MLKKVNIARILGILMIGFSVMFTLSGCSSEDANQSPKSDKELAQDHRECWQDKVLILLYDTMGTVAMGTYTKITKGSMSLMMVAFAIWFALRLLKFVTSVKDASGENAEMWNEVLKKLLICFICGYLATSTEGLLWILNTVVFPIYNAFLEFGGKVLEKASQTVGDGRGSTIQAFGESIPTEKGIVCNAEGASTATLDGFPTAPRNMMSCMICSVNERLSLGNALALEVMRSKSFMAIIVGLLIMVSFTIVKLGFVFYLVDTIFRFTMMVVLLPILIMAYAFEFTRAWTKKGLETILNSAAFMMVIAILIAMALLAIVQIIGDNPSTFNPPSGTAAFEDFNPAMMSLLMMAFLVKNTLSVAQQMVSKIIGAKTEAKFQKKLKALVQMVGKAVLAWLTAGASKGVEAVQQIQKVKEAIDKVKKSKIGSAAVNMNKKYKKARDKVKKVQDKMNSLAGRGKK